MSADVPTLGILGAGQLAAMLTASANRLGIDVHVFRPGESGDRCSADQLTTGSYDDTEALRQFAASVDAVTVETENIPVDALTLLEEAVPVHPTPAIIEICQDRLLEKRFLAENGIGTARFGPVSSASELREQIEHCGADGIVKTRRFGYDGKGQTRFDASDDVDAVWESHGEVPSILEALVPFDFEISAIAARSSSGEIAMYDPGRNEHRDGILRTTEVPARLEPGVRDDAQAIAERILSALDYVGVMGIEFFVVGTELLVNELAPRVHNSGHWTQEGCVVDQFEQHVRAVMGYPLGSVERHCDVVMTNLIGDDVTNEALTAAAGSRLHLYGKRDVRPGRKMGHTNTVRRRSAD